MRFRGPQALVDRMVSSALIHNFLRQMRTMWPPSDPHREAIRLKPCGEVWGESCWGVEQLILCNYVLSIIRRRIAADLVVHFPDPVCVVHAVRRKLQIPANSKLDLI